MTKELTPLKALKELRSFCGDVYYHEIYDKDYQIIEAALKRLEQVDKSTIAVYEEVNKKLKALEIIKEKSVDVYLLIDSPNLAHYNRNFDYSEYVRLTRHLTQEEFDLLKEVLL